MKIKKFMVLAIILIALIGISAINAAEDSIFENNLNEESDFISDDSLGVSDGFISEDDSNGNDNFIFKDDSNGNPLNDNSNQELTIKSFADLNATINGNYNQTVYLNGTCNYIYNSDTDSDFTDGIFINRNLTLYGNGAVIDGNFTARIFKIYDLVDEVIFYNITFINGKTLQYGAAVYGKSLLVNCSFINNTAGYGGTPGYGGAIYGGNAVDSLFIKNSASFGGAIFKGNALNSTFKFNNADSGGAIQDANATNCTFINNTASAGGALLDGNAFDSTFINNTARDGGAISLGNATNCTFINNTASSDGGALHMGIALDSTFKFNNANAGGAIYEGNAFSSSFSNNSAIYGGALQVSNATDCNFTGNLAEQIGGAINGGTAINSNFIQNSAKDGGAIYNGNATNSTFLENNADKGGAIMLSNASKCNFTSNTANFTGAMYGGIAIDSTFTGNIALRNCGALNDAIAINCNFTSNKANTTSGAAAWSNLTGCIFEDNSAEDGGAIANCNATNSTFINNTALIRGGAASSSYAFNCSFINNTGKYGGAIDKSNASNCSFYNNSADLGGAMLGGIAENSSFIGNIANSSGGAIRMGIALNCSFSSNIALDYGGAMDNGNATNCTFINNTARSGGAMYEGNAIDSSFLLNFAMLKGNEDIYSTSHENCNFIVPLLSVHDYEGKYNPSLKLPIKLTYGNQNFDGFNISISLYRDGEFLTNHSALTGDGWLLELKPGSYEANFSLENSNVESVKASIRILMISTSISANNISTFYNSDDELVINVKDEYGNSLCGLNLTVDFNGKKVYWTDENGQINISSKGFNPDNYTVSIAFEGNEIYVESSSLAEVFIDKSATQLLANDITTVFGSDDQLTITLMQENGSPLANASIFVDLYGEYYKSNDDGQVILPLKDFAARSYSVNIGFDENQFYKESNASIALSIMRLGTSMTASNVIANYYDDKFFIATLIDNRGHPVKGMNMAVYFNDDEEIFTTNEEGQINVSTKKLMPNHYYASIYFAGNENYTSAGAISDVTINKWNSRFDVVISTIDNNATISVNLDSSATGAVEFKIGNVFTYIPIDAGLAVYEDVFDIGVYNVSISYSGDEIFNSITCNREFTVYGHIKKNTTISSNLIVNGLDVTLTVNLNPNVTGFVKFKINDENIYVKPIGGKAILNTVLPAGNYDVKATYLGDNDFNENSTSCSFSLKKYSTEISSSDVSLDYGTAKNILISLKDGDNNVLLGKTISVSLNGKTYIKATNGDGQISISVPSDLAPGKYLALISFSGDDFFEQSSKSITVIVKKLNPKLTLKKKTFKAKAKKKKYSVSLKTNKNKAMKNVKLVLKVKGKKYTAKTNKKGVAIFKISNLKKKGKFKVSVTYAGSKYYNKIVKRSILTVKK